MWTSIDSFIHTFIHLCKYVYKCSNAPTYTHTHTPRKTDLVNINIFIHICPHVSFIKCSCVCFVCILPFVASWRKAAFSVSEAVKHVSLTYSYCIIICRLEGCWLNNNTVNQKHNHQYLLMSSSVGFGEIWHDCFLWIFAKGSLIEHPTSHSYRANVRTGSCPVWTQCFYCWPWVTAGNEDSWGNKSYISVLAFPYYNVTDPQIYPGYLWENKINNM